MKRLLLVLGFIAASSALIADELILDYEFADGEIASGSEVNANFGALERKANEHDVEVPNGNTVLGNGLSNIVTLVEGYDDPESPVGSKNTALGVGALMLSNYGSDNTAVGFEALRDLSGSVGQDGSYTFVSAGQGNTAVGSKALMSETNGDGNTAVGAEALRDISGENFSNTAVGNSAMVYFDSGFANTAVGYYALRGSSSNGGDIASSSNTALGAYAMNFNQGGSQNVAVGVYALDGYLSGDNNTAVGYNAQSHNRAGSNNTAVGASSRVTGRTGLNEGDENTAVGAFAEVGNSTASFSNSTALGFQATATADNQITLGNASVTSLVTQGKLTTKQVTYPNLTPKNVVDPILVYVGNGIADWRPAADYLAANWDESAVNDELLALRQEVERQREELMAIIERQQQQIAALERVVSMEQFAAR